MPYFQQSRNIELSMLYYLETEINANWSNISVVKTFKQATKADLPVVCIRLSNDESTRLEVSTNTLVSDYLIIVDIFSTSDGMRLDLSQFIKDKIKDGCIYYTHTQTGGVLTRTSAGRITIRDIVTNAPLDFGDSAESHDRYRQRISFTVRKNY